MYNPPLTRSQDSMNSLWRRLQYYALFLRSLMNINRSLLVGMWKLTKLPQPAITVFGGTKLTKESKYSKKIHLLAHRLADRGFSIITGGGPGIMAAANLGAYETAEHIHIGEKTPPVTDSREDQRRIISIGIGVDHLQEKNVYLHEYIVLPYFFIRKWLLVRYSVGFIIGPGGFGTLDELCEVVTLIQTRRMRRMPIVMIGVEYWEPFYEWIHTRALRDGLLTQEDAKLIHITDDIEDAFNIMVKYCSGDSTCALDFKPD